MVLQFHALLEGSSPRVWRRFLINGDDTVKRLIDALLVMFQMSVGYHLYHLEKYVLGATYGSQPKYMPTAEIEAASWDDFSKILPAENYAIKRLVKKEGDQLRFFYDYGDDWTVRLKLEAKLKDDEYDGKLPYAVKGKGAGIVEDCGGVWALNEMMQDEKEFGVTDDEDSLLLFDVEAVNAAL